MKNFYRKIRKPILVTMTYLAFVVYLFAMCSLDSPTYKPYFVAVFSGCFLILRAKAEGWFEDGRRKDF